MDDQGPYTWPYPGQLIYPRLPGAKWQSVCEFCVWEWFSPTYTEACQRMKQHLLDKHDIDIDHLPS